MKEALKIVNECIEKGKIIPEAFEFSFFYTIKEALEKQIPKVPNLSVDHHDYYCPCCDACIADVYAVNYCCECGQAIKWREMKDERI